MKLVIVSSKPVWHHGDRGCVVTTGGFPFQISTVSLLFHETELVVMRNGGDPPPGCTEISGSKLLIRTLREPAGTGFSRKLFFPVWLLGNLRNLWSSVGASDAVHVPLPGDVGISAVLIALLQRKPLFVRHCGTWGNRTTLADKFLAWLLPRIAGGRNVVLATGGGDRPPEPGNPSIRWIFSTSIGADEMARMPRAEAWQPGTPLRLITVGRLTRGKNARAIVEALPAIREAHPHVHLDILGEGEEMAFLRKQIIDLGLESHVALHGNVNHDRVIDLLAQAHLFVFPTRVKEGFPKALLEALAVGLPAVASDVSVIPHLIQGCGLVLEAAGPQDITRAVLKLADRPAEWPAMARRARQVASQYTLERWRDEIGRHLEAAWGPLKDKS